MRRRLYHIVPGVLTPVLAKHSKSFSLIDCVSVAGALDRSRALRDANDALIIIS